MSILIGHVLCNGDAPPVVHMPFRTLIAFAVYLGRAAMKIQRTMFIDLRSGHADHLHPANHMTAEVVSMFGSSTAPVPSLVSNLNWTHKAVCAIRCPQASPQEIAAYMHSDLGRLSPYSVRMFGVIPLTTCTTSDHNRSIAEAANRAALDFDWQHAA
jgi:hypothetical protein